MKTFLSCFILLSLLYTPCFSAGRISDLQAEVAELKDQLRRVSQKNKSLQQQNQDNLEKVQRFEKTLMQFKADNSVLVEDLRTEINTLQGQLELQKHEAETFRTESQRSQKDFDFRLSELEAKPNQTSKVEKKLPSKTPLKEYNSLLSLIQNQKKYTQAIPGLKDFIRNYPGHSLIANAQYWLGESYYALGKYSHAIREFDVVVKKHSKSNKKCDALFKQALGFDALKRKKESTLFYQEVISQCPKSVAAKQSKKKLAPNS